MSALAPWRAEVRALIPRGFLRRDPGDALFISDYPRLCDGAAVGNALAGAGFFAAEGGGLSRIDAEPEKYRALMRALTPGEIPAPTDETLYLRALALRLLRAQTPPERQEIAPLRLALKCLDAGDLAALSGRLPPLLAAMQRRGAPLPSAVGALIFRALCER